MKRTLVLLGVLLVGTIFSVNVLTDDELHNLVDSVNVIRSLEPATLPILTLDGNLSALALEWTDKCSFTADRKLKWLYSNVWIKTDANTTAFDVSNIHNQNCEEIRVKCHVYSPYHYVNCNICSLFTKPNRHMRDCTQDYDLTDVVVGS